MGLAEEQYYVVNLRDEIVQKCDDHEEVSKYIEKQLKLRVDNARMCLDDFTVILGRKLTLKKKVTIIAVDPEDT